MQMAQLKKSLSKDILVSRMHAHIYLHYRDNLTQPEFEKALSTKLDFPGAFSFNKIHLDAPNPSLKIQGLGTIGIPLSTHDAEAIKSKAQQAPFSMGEKTVIDTNVRDTWEIDENIVSQHMNDTVKPDQSQTRSRLPILDGGLSCKLRLKKHVRFWA